VNPSIEGRTTVVVAFGDVYTDSFDDLWVLDFDVTAPWSQDWLPSRVAEMVAGLSGDSGWVPHDLTVTQRYHSWGAAGAGQEVVLKLATMAADGVVATLAYNAIRTLFADLTDRLTRDPLNKGYVQRREITMDEARERARWMVAQRYSRNLDSIRITGESEDREDGSWVVELADERHAYEVAVRLIDGLAPMTRIRRREVHD
jgi:hypothetical protein